MTVELNQDLTLRMAEKSGGGVFESVMASGSGQPGTNTITGSGFGSGPTVALFDRATGVDGQSVSLVADIGQWTGENTQTSEAVAGAKYYDFGGRTWITGRKIESVSLNQKDLTGMRYEHSQKYNQFFRSWRMVIPTGYKMPGATAANSKDGTGTNSIWKMDWHSLRPYSYVADNDLVIPTLVYGALNVTGNAITPEAVGTGSGSGNDKVSFSYSALSAVNENLFSYYCSGDESSPGAKDATIETVQHTNGTFLRTIHPNCDPWATGPGGPPTERFLDTFLCNGWMGNVASWVDVLPLFADQYLAVGPNCAARIYTHDAPTLAGSTKVYLVPPDTWTSTEITYTPTAYENLDYKSVVLADLTLLENV